jgi:hypothetical protein
MQLGDVEILTRPDTRAWLMAHRNDDPAVTLALSRKDNANLPPVVYSQLKILRKGSKKAALTGRLRAVFLPKEALSNPVRKGLPPSNPGRASDAWISPSG